MSQPHSVPTQSHRNKSRLLITCPTCRTSPEPKATAHIRAPVLPLPIASQSTPNTTDTRLESTPHADAYHASSHLTSASPRRMPTSYHPASHKRTTTSCLLEAFQEWMSGRWSRCPSRAAYGVHACIWGNVCSVWLCNMGELSTNEATLHEAWRRVLPALSNILIERAWWVR
jgi:hypothetical protein